MPTPFPWPWPYGYSPGAQWEIEPEGLFAGSTLRFCKLLPCYPASLWTLNYGLVPWSGRISGPIRFSSAPLHNSDWHLIDLAASATAAWVPARYRWQVYAQANAQNPNPADNFYVGQGEITVSANLTTAAAMDTRGKWQRILDEIDALIEQIAGDPQEEIAIGRGTIAGQTLKGWDREKLVAFRDYALHMAGNETRIQNGRGGAPNPRYKFAVMTGSGQGLAWNGFPDVVPFS